MSQKVEIDGAEVEVYTADEVTARETAARDAAAGEWKPKYEQTTAELAEARKALGNRAEEFSQFRKMSDEQKAKLTEQDRVIYENQLALNAEREKNVASEKVQKEAAVTSAIRSKVGSDEKLFAKVKGMYDVLGLDGNTPEQIASKVAAAIGALGGTEPDLLAAAGFSVGGFEPPKQGNDKASFADSEGGKGLAAALGLKTEYTVEEKKRLNLI